MSCDAEKAATAGGFYGAMGRARAARKRKERQEQCQVCGSSLWPAERAQCEQFKAATDDEPYRPPGMR